MEFYHLRSFVAVAQTGSLTQAAKRLYTTPPAISAHIKTLEEELSTPLFLRSSKGMSLTEKGQLLLKKAQITLDSAVDLVNFAATQQDQIIGTFRFAINIPAERVRLTQLINNIQQHCPGISLDIDSSSTGSIIDLLFGQQLDGGYIFGEVPEGLHGIAVCEQKITTVAPKDVDCDKLNTQAQLQSLPWIMMGDYCPFDDFLKHKLGPNLPSILKTNDDGTRLQLVKAGLGLSFLEWEEAQQAALRDEVQVIPLLDFSTTLHFVVSKKRLNEPLVKVLLQEIHTLWQLD